MISDKNYILDDFNPAAIARQIAERMRQRRLGLNLTQQRLADKSGVSLGTLKRFESNCEISLKHLLMLAVVLDATDDFILLFSRKQYESIDDLLEETKSKSRERGRRNV